MRQVLFFISILGLGLKLCAQKNEGFSQLNIDSLLIEYIDDLSASEEELLEISSINQGKKRALALNNKSSKFFFDVQKHFRIGYYYLFQDYGNYGSENARYLADGLKHQAENKPIYYNSVRLINKLSRKMLRTNRMHRFLKFRDKLLWQFHELKSVTVPS